MHDVIIIGAGPAGLSAALWLGRCRRSTLVFDDGNPRNAASLGLHGYLTRDGTRPAELRQLARAEVLGYPCVQIEETTVVDVATVRGGFEVTTKSGQRATGGVLLLATGRTDPLPNLPDARAFYGRGLYHCPYCDGWEHREQPLAALGNGPATADMVKLLSTWSPDITLCTDGAELAPEAEAGGCPARSEKIVRLVADPNGRLARLDFASGGSLACRALFFGSNCVQKSSLPERLGCQLDDEGSVRCNGHAATNVPGLFVAGNVRGGVHLAIMAAAEGAEAALAINGFLLGQGRVPSLEH